MSQIVVILFMVFMYLCSLCNITHVILLMLRTIYIEMYFICGCQSSEI